MALGSGDPAEAVARVAAARRDRLLRVNRRRLRWEDLEDCYSQATLELVARARRDPFASPEHILNALEQKFSSRIDDRRRAIGGRSPIETAIAKALPVDVPAAGELEDRTAEVVRQVSGRIELARLREVAAELTGDQRLVLACQISLGMDCAEFCGRFGWSGEKYRKVAQRARARLRTLVAEYRLGERCRRLEPDLLAYAAHAASDEQTRRARAHVANCSACASELRALDRASRQIAALLPAPIAAKAGVLAKLGALGLAVRRLFGPLGRGASETGAAGVAGGSAIGAGAMKLGVSAACLAGAAGGYAICVQGRAGHPVGGPHHAGTSLRRVIPTASLAGSGSRPSPSRAAGRDRPTRSQARPVSDGATSAIARREFGAEPAQAAAEPARPATELARAAAALAPSGSGSGGPRSAETRRAFGQARREFGGFER